MLSRLRESLLQDNRVVPVVLAILAVLILAWVIFGLVLGSENQSQVANQETVAQSQGSTADSASQASAAPQAENRNVDSYAAYTAKDPFRQLAKPADSGPAPRPVLPPVLYPVAELAATVLVPESVAVAAVAAVVVETMLEVLEVPPVEVPPVEVPPVEVPQAAVPPAEIPPVAEEVNVAEATGVGGVPAVMEVFSIVAAVSSAAGSCSLSTRGLY